MTLPAGAFNLRQISHDDGLSNSAVLSIHQDVRGTMWFGTCDGLNSFDGMAVTVYQVAGGGGLSGNMIEGIIETPKNVFWIQTNYGLNSLNIRNGHIGYYPLFKGGHLLKGEQDELFLLSGDSLFFETAGSFIGIKSLGTQNAINGFIDEKENLYLFYRDGTVAIYTIEKNVENTTLRFISESKVSPSGFKCCFQEGSTMFYLTRKGELFEYTPEYNRFVADFHTVLAQKGDVSSIVKYKEDYFIGFKTSGLLHLSYLEDKKAYQVNEIGIKAGVFCLYKDRYQDILWVGTDGQGVFQLYESTYTLNSYTFDNSSLKINSPVRALFLDEEHTLWIGTKGDGLVKIPHFKLGENLFNVELQQISMENSALSDNSIYAISSSSRDLFWIGHEDGVDYYSYASGQLEKLNLTYKGNPIKYIHGIIEQNDSVLWLASVGDGIIRVLLGLDAHERPVAKEVKRILVADGTSESNHFFTNYMGSGHSLWYGNRGGGLYHVNTETLKVSSLQLGDKMGHQLLNDVFSICVDDVGNLWCGTSFGLAKCRETGKVEIFNQKSGFENNTVHGILKGSDGYIWLSTNMGIICFDVRKETFQTYTKYNGLNVTEFSDGAFYKDPQTGILLFGGVNGFVSVSNSGYIPRCYQPNIIFDYLILPDSTYDIDSFCTWKDGQRIFSLSHDKNLFSISFSVNDYINGNNYSYYYQLEGLNDQWIDNRKNKIISFANLPPDEYKLNVKYRNRLSGQESPVYGLIFYIRPPWYASMGAYMIYSAVIIISIGFVISRIIAKNQKKHQDSLEKLQREHERELYDSKLQFFTSLAYDFCAPLTLIYAPCNQILAHEKDDKFVIKYTKAILRNAERLNGLMQKLMEFRRIEAGNRIPYIKNVQVTELLHKIIYALSKSIKGIELKLRCEIPDVLCWNSDEHFIYTIVANLLSNVMRFSENNEIMTLKVGIEKNYLCLAIFNVGEKVEKHLFSYVIDRNKILKDLESGEEDGIRKQSYLELIISYDLVKLLNGNFEIEKNDNGEVVIKISLPNLPISVTEKGKNDLLLSTPLLPVDNMPITLPEYELKRGRQTVFVMDENVEVLWIICEIFKDEFNVIPYNKKVSSIEDVFVSKLPDLIIWDVLTPNENIISLVRQIKSSKNLAHVPLILMSSRDDIDDQIKSLDAGADLYMSKPFNVEVFKISVQRLMSSKEVLKTYLSSPLSVFELIDNKLVRKEDKSFLEKVVDVISDNLKDEALSASFVAAKLGMSTRHMHRRIMAISDKSVSDMIKESRIHVAEQLLQKTQMTIEEVMYNAGFQNRATFYKSFALKHNCTPREYRDSFAKDTELGITQV